MHLLAAKPADCTGCRTCELICALQNYRENNPAMAALRIRGLFPAPGHYDLRICDQCGKCAEACPNHAIYRRDDGVYLVDTSVCGDCQACVAACPTRAMFTHESLESPIKCNSCGECVVYCPRKVLALEGGN